MEKYERGTLEQHHVELMCNALEESLLTCLLNNGAYTNVKDKDSHVFTPMQLLLCDAAYILCRLLCIPPTSSISYINNEAINKDTEGKSVSSQSYTVMKDPVARTLGICFAKVLMHSLISVTNTSSPNFDAFNAIVTGFNHFVESYHVILLSRLSPTTNTTATAIDPLKLDLEFVMHGGNRTNSDVNTSWKHGNQSYHEVCSNTGTSALGQYYVCLTQHRPTKSKC